ncbi:major capsid protein [Nonomuraea lactucae]|uniref:major capsid protein n=1 Tax=Nonomuraea lactucae TaxID=2249762 RepID=UPI000DE32880|nr:phage major capsid protein [Nonomuraea lactucae]
MAITLADAQRNAASDVDYAVIDETRRGSWLLDQITFDDTATPGTGGGTLTYTYARLTQTRGGQFRAFNTEYTPSEAKRTQITSSLYPFGGAYNLDRALAHLGPRLTDEMAFQTSELIKGCRVTFADQLINGDHASNVLGFDGLDVALTGSVTEHFQNTSTYYVDWSPATIDTVDESITVSDQLDEFLSLLNGEPDALLGNRLLMNRVKAIAKRAGQYNITQDSLGRTIERYGNAVLVDLGTKNDDFTGNSYIVPVETRDPDGGGGGGNITNLTDLYAVRFGMDALHGASVAGSPLMKTWDPDWTTSGAVKTGELEMGPATLVLKHARSCGVFRNIKVK